MKTLLYIFLVLALCVVSGCSDDPTSVKDPVVRPSSEVEAFVAQEQFTRFRDTNQIMNWNGVEVFVSEYGEGLDCPSGCFYSKAFGMYFDDRIGWLGFEDFHGHSPDSTRFFDFIESDAILFDVDTWFVLIYKNWWACFDRLLPALASDEDTSRDALLVQSTLIYTHESVDLAQRLISNQKVRGDIEILGILAGLPVIRTDVYVEVRAEAQALLDARE